MKTVQDMWYRLISTITAPSIADIVDILIVAFLIYECIALVRQTHAAQLAKGIIILLASFFAADIFELHTLKFFLQGVMQVGFLALVIVFQPELRRALEQMGRANIFAVKLFRSSTDDDDMRVKWLNTVVAVCDAVERMAESRTGALIVFERKSNLSEIIKTGTKLHADVNPELLGTIFYEGTPLHDGATIIRDAQVEAGGCFLPLSNNLEISKDMGTRHRAALGMSENSDAVIVVVSEETGIISLAKNGVLIRRLDRQNLFNLLEGDIVPPLPEEEKKKPLFRRKKDAK
ncbi:MAG: diadenylate cyclase CdaA [Oscillospiraceae bacterium]